MRHGHSHRRRDGRDDRRRRRIAVDHPHPGTRHLLLTDLDPTLAAVAATGLRGDNPVRTDHSGFPQLLAGARQHRLLPFLEATALDISTEQTAVVRAAARSAASITARVDEAAGTVSTQLTRAGIEHRLLKGATAACLYRRPELRSYSDVDVLVQGHDMPTALATLANAGWTRRHPSRSARWDRRLTKAVALDGPQGIAVDLHRTLASGPLGFRIDLDELFTTPPRAVPIGEASVPALGVEHTFVHLCLHATTAPMRYLSLRDVAEVVTGGAIDLPATYAIAWAWRCRAAVRRAVDLTWRRLSLPTHPTVLAISRWDDDVDERRMLSAYEAHASTRRIALATWRAIPTWRDRVAFVRALAWPDAAFVADRGGSRLGLFRDRGRFPR